jgi:hypothetical protein
MITDYWPGIGSFVTTYVSIIGFSYTGERITKQIRELYLRAIFRQNIAFFDFLGSGGTSTWSTYRIEYALTLNQKSLPASALI